MAIHRRHLLSVTLKSVAAASLAHCASMAYGGIDSERQYILAILRHKFPHLETKHEAVDSYITDLLNRNADELGSTLISLREAKDDHDYSLTFERFVCQDFVMNTNYLMLGQQHTNELCFYAPS